MNRIKKYFAFSFAVIALSLVGFDAQTFAAKPEKSIEQKIAGKLRSLPRYGVFDHIEYQVQGDTVVLTGKTITIGTKRDAAAYVKEVPGIKNVVNNIEELPIGSFDNNIRRAAYLTLTNRGPAQYFSTIDPDVRIVVENGRITLEGFVAHKGDSDLIYILARGLSGVFEVTNNLVIGRDLRKA